MTPRASDALGTLAGLVGLVLVGWALGSVIGHPVVDRTVTDWVVGHRTSILDAAAPWISTLAAPIVTIPLTVATVAVLWRHGPRVAAYAVASTVTVAVGLSRVYLGVHWVTDVVVGWVLGAAWLALVIRRSGHRSRAMTRA